jgi:hypothetical protein
MEAKEMSMAKKMSESNSDLSATNGSLPKGAKGNGKKGSKTSSKKRVLTRKEKLEAAKKANQAMMKAWKLISQRKDNGTDAESNF